jgi:AhpD family alkylhydroperoxidase
MSQRIDYQTVSPNALKALGGVYMHVAKSGLPKEIVDLVYLRVSQINGCAYCVNMHSTDLLKGGVDTTKVLLVSAWEEAGAVFTDKERAALKWAESVTLVSETHAPDADYQALAPHYSEQEIVDLTVAIGLMNVYNRIAISFRRPPEVAA